MVLCSLDKQRPACNIAATANVRVASPYRFCGSLELDRANSVGDAPRDDESGGPAPGADWHTAVLRRSDGKAAPLRAEFRSEPTDSRRSLPASLPEEEEAEAVDARGRLRLTPQMLCRFLRRRSLPPAESRLSCSCASISSSASWSASMRCSCTSRSWFIRSACTRCWSRSFCSSVSRPERRARALARRERISYSMTIPTPVMTITTMYSTVLSELATIDAIVPSSTSSMTCPASE